MKARSSFIEWTYEGSTKCESKVATDGISTHYQGNTYTSMWKILIRWLQEIFFISCPIFIG